MSGRHLKLLWGSLFVCGVLAGCASGPEKPKPQPLEPIASPIAGRMVWSKRMDDVQFPLSVAVNGGTFTVAASDGTE
jgi:outer membrane protein assembly factor BamB